MYSSLGALLVGWWLCLPPVHALPGLPGLPGGGTSLAFTNDISAAVIPDFTHLSGAVNYSMEAWVYSMSAIPQPSVLTFATSDNMEYWSFVMGDDAFFSLNGESQMFPFESPGFMGWRHVAMTVTDGDVRGYVNGTLIAQYNWSAPAFADSAFFVISKYTTGWDNATLQTATSLNFLGYIDEIRVWNTTLTQEELQTNMHRRLSEDTPNLVVQWHFDDLTDSPDGLLALSAQGIPLSLVDSTNLQDTSCGGSTRPLHAANAAPIFHTEQPYIAVSYIASSAVDVTMAFDMNITVLPTQGTLTAGGAVVSFNGTIVPANTTLVYQSHSENFTGDGFTYTATLDDNSSALGQVRLHLDHPPTAAGVNVVAPAEKSSSFFLPHDDVDGDILSCVIATLPAQGLLFQSDGTPITAPGTAVSNPGCEVMFQSSGYSWGLGYASFEYGVSERALRQANDSYREVRATVSVDVTFTNALPALSGEINATLLEDSRGVNISINASDPNGDITTILLGSLPTKGTLYRSGRAVTSLVPAMNSTALYASVVVDFSSEYPSEPATGILGPQEVFTYGDDPRAWSTLGNNFTCRDSQFCYTEFIVLKFDYKLYPTNMVIAETDGPRSLVRVLTPNFYDPEQWLTLWMGTALPIDPNAPLVRSIPICATPFPVDTLRLEFDCSQSKTFFEVDMVQLVGTYDAPSSQVGPPHELFYEPYPLHDGQDSFSFTLSDCPNQFLQITSPFIYT
eukprot:RCo052448